MSNLPRDDVEHLVKTEEEWKNEIETSAVTLMAAYGWCDPALRNEMERAIENAITKLDKKYTNMKKSEEERKKERKKEDYMSRAKEICTALKWGGATTATKKLGVFGTPRDAERSQNYLFGSAADRKSTYSITCVHVTDSDGNLFRFQTRSHNQNQNDTPIWKLVHSPYPNEPTIHSGNDYDDDEEETVLSDIEETDIAEPGEIVVYDPWDDRTDVYTEAEYEEYKRKHWPTRKAWEEWEQWRLDTIAKNERRAEKEMERREGGW
jgi:hypothetical protein